MKLKLFIISVFVIMIVFIMGCTTTITLEDEYDVRVVNRTGDTVTVRFDDGSYHDIEDDGVLIISSVDFGYHELILEWDSPSGRRNYKKVYEFKVTTDFEIVLKDDSDDSVIIIEY